MKKYILSVAAALLSLCSFAQSGYNYSPYAIGFGVSGIKPHADLNRELTDIAYNVNFTYYFSPYVPVVLELQKGRLRGGGDLVSEDKDTRKFENNYITGMFHLNYQLGESIDYERNFFLNAIKNFYAGIGFGFIYNNVKANRFSLIDPNYEFPGNDKSLNTIVPLRIGYEFKIFDYDGAPRFAIDIGYQHNFTFGEGLDGYNDPSSKFKNNALDQYRQATIGIKYNFGPMSSYDKNIGRGY